ncbi:MAG TPA: hypothetical protein VK138_02870 [Acidiferrobacterales bacterium]|nr:hypothetical protein [Acidiferrobacterales bacterium]
MSRTPLDPRSPKDIWDEQHSLLAKDPIAWVLKADQLIAAFEHLATETICRIEAQDTGPEFSGVALMLAGFAIENLMKGLLVQKQSPVNEKGKFELVSHDLLKLAKDVSLPLTEDECRLLEKLGEFLTWTGRYPVPLTSEPMRPRTLPSGGFAPRTYGQVGEDWPAVRTFIAKLKKHLPRINYETPRI